MHLTIEDFENYLSTGDLSPETLAAIEPIQLHLDGCEQCRNALSHLIPVYHTIADESLASSAALLNHEKAVRRGLVFTMLYRKLNNALPQEQNSLRKLISAFNEKRYRTYHIDKLEKTPVIPPLPDLFQGYEPEPAEPKPDKPQSPAPIDFAALLREQKKGTPSGSSFRAPLPAAASIRYQPNIESYSYNYDGKELIISATLNSAASHMILKPEQGLELPQIQPVVNGPGNNSYEAVFPLEAPGGAYQVLVFSND